MAGAATEPTLVLSIEKLVAGGLGLGRHAGQVVLVEGAVPGDRLVARVTERHAGYLRARLERVLEPGPGRRTPPCPHVERCGGCTLQHLEYEAQVEAKLAILRESFARTAAQALPEPVRVHRSPEWGYRRRARFHVARDPGGSLRLGFRARDGRSVVGIGPCAVLTPALEAELPRLRARLAARGARHEEVSVLDAEEGVVTDGPGHVLAGEDRLEASARLFFQASAPLLDELVARVHDLAAAVTPATRAWDLYCGVGLFTLGLARRHAAVVAVEGSADAAQRALANAAAAGLENIRVVAGAVEDVLERAEAAELAGAVIVADPPREGLDRRVRAVLRRTPPRRLVYVSCDPVTAARDVRDLAQGGLRVVAADFFDLFPQTHHIETVLALDSDRTPLC